LKTVIFLGVATMAWPRSDLDRLKKKDVNFHLDKDNVKGMALHFRLSKEKKTRLQSKYIKQSYKTK
jgi:hypothetical protein